MDINGNQWLLGRQENKISARFQGFSSNVNYTSFAVGEIKLGKTPVLPFKGKCVAHTNTQYIIVTFKLSLSLTLTHIQTHHQT